jgi:hypothetical protein
MNKLKLLLILLIFPIGISANCLIVDEINQDWETIDFRKISFKIPNPYSSTVSLANTNQYTWLTNNERISITIDIGNIPNGKENLRINELIPNIKSFAQEVNNGNKRDFSDFKILSQEYINLGDTKAVLVNQQSKKVSGKNKLFNVHSYFVTAKPHFYSIVISYDTQSYEDRKVAEKIASSFIFNKKQGPSLNETKKWLTDKIVDKIRSKYENSGELGYGFSSWTTYPTYFGAIKDNLIFEHKVKYSEDNIRHERVIIPLKEITSIDFENGPKYSGECDFKIYTNTNRMTIINLKTKKKTFGEYYQFRFDCSEEEDLGTRFNTAIKHLKNIVPDYSKPKKKETF